jgi:hypothetical protein
VRYALPDRNALSCSSVSLLLVVRDVDERRPSDMFHRERFALLSGLPVIQQQCQREVSWTGCSALRFNLSSEGLGYYLPVPHNKCVGSEFVRIVCCFCGPENIGVITLNASLLHRKRGTRLSKLRNESLKEGLDRVWTF